MTLRVVDVFHAHSKFVKDIHWVHFPARVPKLVDQGIDNSECLSVWPPCSWSDGIIFFPEFWIGPVTMVAGSSAPTVYWICLSSQDLQLLEKGFFLEPILTAVQPRHSYFTLGFVRLQSRPRQMLKDRWGADNISLCLSCVLSPGGSPIHPLSSNSYYGFILGPQANTLILDVDLPDIICLHHTDYHQGPGHSGLGNTLPLDLSLNF